MKRTGILLCTLVPLMLGGKCPSGGGNGGPPPASDSHIYIICYPEHFFLGEEGCNASPNLVVHRSTETNQDWAFPEIKYAEEPNYPDGSAVYGLHFEIDWTSELLANIEQAGIFPATIPGCTNASWHDASVTPWVTQISIVDCNAPLDITTAPLTLGILGMVSYENAELDLTIPITTKNTIALREDGTLAKRPKSGVSSITIAEALP
jgi:hypothetical protein